MLIKQLGGQEALMNVGQCPLPGSADQSLSTSYIHNFHGKQCQSHHHHRFHHHHHQFHHRHASVKRRNFEFGSNTASEVTVYKKMRKMQGEADWIFNKQKSVPVLSNSTNVNIFHSARIMMSLQL